MILLIDKTDGVLRFQAPEEGHFFLFLWDYNHTAVVENSKCSILVLTTRANETNGGTNEMVQIFQHSHYCCVDIITKVVQIDRCIN